MAGVTSPGSAMSGAAGGARRPCPYCGMWNEPEFSFCAKCGRQLPSLAATAAPPSATAPPPPPASMGLPPPPAFAAVPSPAFPAAPAVAFAAAAAAPTGVDPSPVTDRPLTDAERALLNTRIKAGPVNAVRVFGAFLGLLPLVFVATALMGTPYDPDTYLGIVLVAGILGLIASAAGRNLRLPVLRAVRSGVAHELHGVPQIQAAAGNESLVTVSELTFRMKASDAALLLPQRMNRLTFADGGPAAGPRRATGVVAFLLEANGTPSGRAEPCALVSAPGLEAAVAAPAGLARKGVR